MWWIDRATIQHAKLLLRLSQNVKSKANFPFLAVPLQALRIGQLHYMCILTDYYP